VTIRYLGASSCGQDARNCHKPRGAGNGARSGSCYVVFGHKGAWPPVTYNTDIQ
jgi:hypothetical protein